MLLQSGTSEERSVESRGGFSSHSKKFKEAKEREKEEEKGGIRDQ